MGHKLGGGRMRLGKAMQDRLVSVSSGNSLDVLELAAHVTGMRCVVAARVTERVWLAVDAVDRAGFGVRVGEVLDARLTFCHEVRETCAPVFFSDAEHDPGVRASPLPERYGMRSYVAVPLYTRDGTLFGTLCAFDPEPRPVTPAIIDAMQRLADLYGSALDSSGDRLQADAELAQTTSSLGQSRQHLLMSTQDLRAAQVLAKQREEFIAVLAHDLRNPLQSIGMAASLLEMGGLSERQSKQVGHIQESVKRMAELIEVTLDFARGRLAGGVPLDKREAARLEELLCSAVNEIRQAHPESTIHTAMNIDDAVDCDPHRLAQLLSNLLINAIVHGHPQSEIQVIASTRDACFRLSVANRGTITAGKIERIFEPFNREGEARLKPGLGLGLYIASQIALAHGGALKVVSTESNGTMFEFQMPL